MKEGEKHTSNNRRENHPKDIDAFLCRRQIEEVVVVVVVWEESVPKEFK